MDTDGHGCVSREETHRIIGCAMSVLNELGHGLLEKPYENALAVEFGLQGITFRQQARYDVMYKGVVVGEYIPRLDRIRQGGCRNEGHRENWGSRSGTAH